MKHLGYITDADSIFLWFPSQNRTFLGRKPYVFGSETVRFWDGEQQQSLILYYPFMRKYTRDKIELTTKGMTLHPPCGTKFRI